MANALKVKLVQVSLPIELVKQVDHLRIDMRLTRSAIVKLMLEEAIRSWTVQKS